MPHRKAKKHFLGQDGHQRMNCAQSVLTVLEEIDPVLFERARRYAGGMAPGGDCGAYHVAKAMLENCCPQKLSELDALFNDLAGSTTCRDIRKIGKLSCVGCVEKAAEFLHNSKLGQP